jgi:hypothetical protein
VRLGVGRFTVPARGRLEREADAGAGGAGVPVVDGQGQPERGRVEDDAGLFAGFADGDREDALAVLEVSRRQSWPEAQVFPARRSSRSFPARRRIT